MKFICIVAYIRCKWFHIFNSIPLNEYATFCLFSFLLIVSSLVDIMNRAAVKTHVPTIYIFIFLVKISRELLRVGVYFLEIANFQKYMSCFWFPQPKYVILCCSTSLSTLWIVSHVNFRNSSKHVELSHFGFNFHFLDIFWCWLLLHLPLFCVWRGDYSVSFFWRKYFWPYWCLTVLCCFIVIWCRIDSSIYNLCCTNEFMQR